MAAPIPAASAFGLTKWEAGTCTASRLYSLQTRPQFYTQAAGHPPFGITDFGSRQKGSEAPEGHIEEVRVDIPPGLSVDPLATPQCKLSELEGAGCPPDTQVGKVQLTAHVAAEILGLKPALRSNLQTQAPKPPSTTWNRLLDIRWKRRSR